MKNPKIIIGLKLVMVLPLAVLIFALVVTTSEGDPGIFRHDVQEKVFLAPNSENSKSVATSHSLSGPGDRHYIDVFFRKHGQILLKGKEGMKLTPLAEIRPGNFY